MKGNKDKMNINDKEYEEISATAIVTSYPRIFTDIPYENWVETIKTTVPPKFLDVNLKAFDLGYNL